MFNFVVFRPYSQYLYLIFKKLSLSSPNISANLRLLELQFSNNDLEPIGLQIELTGSFLNFRRAQLIGLQIGRFLKSHIFVAFYEQIHVNLSKL